ncbi:MAG: efflux RND transporter periplasmic adaptor subunit [Vulcanimicrobiaceae bacterium]
MHTTRTISLALLCATSLVACGGAKAPNGPPTLSVATAIATRQAISTTLSLDGQIAPLESSTLSFQQSGPIAAIYVNVGDRVSKGELLAKIDDSTLRAQLAAAEATAAQAGSNARSQQITLPLTAKTNQAALDGAKAALANAQLNYNQSLQLFKQGYLSQSALATARSQFAAAQSDFNRALGSVQGNSANVATVDAAQSAAQAAQANANLLRTEIAQTALYAPFDGVVSERLMDPGAMAGPNTPVFQVSRIADVWLNINVPDSDLAYVKSGKMVNFTSSSLPGRTFSGTISAVNAVPTTGTLSYLARIRQPNPDGALRGGMLVSVIVVKEHHNDAVVVPRSAIAQTAAGSQVFVIENGKAKAVPVQVGIQTDTMSQVIASGVQPGAQVITTRPDALHDGSPVSVAGAPTPAASPAGKAK